MLWTVEDVLAEAPAGPDHPKYFLIRWTGFELYDSTWEPKNHLEEATIQSWEETKDAIKRGEREVFDVADWWNARSDHLRGRLDRARRRDAKKLAQGRPLTGNAAVLEEQLKDHLAQQSEYYGTSISDLLNESSDSDVNEAVLPPLKALDLPTSPPAVQEPPRLQIQPRKPADAQHNAVSPTEGCTGVASTLTTGASASAEQQMEQPPQSKTGGRSGAPSPTTSSTTPNILQPSRQTQFTAPKRNDLKAKRTGGAAGTQGAGANIFTSGKVTRKRRDLAEIMKDPTKENRFFSKHRIARIAYKKSREKEDLPPATVSSKLFDISKGPEINTPKQTEGPRQTEVKRRTTDDGGPKSAEDDTVAPTQKKRKKSVRFCDMSEKQSSPPMFDNGPRSEPVVPDEPGLFVEGSPHSPTRVKTERDDIIPSPTPLSIDDNLQFDSSMTIRKIVDFGSGGGRKLEVSLDGIPNTPDEPWFVDLMGREEISFTHTCVAKNLAFQLENITVTKICSGHLRSDTASEALGNVSSRLKLGSFGAVCFRDGYIIVVYPKRCNDWETDVFDAGAASPSEVDLGYMLFTRGLDGNPPPDQAPPLERPSDDPRGDRGIVWQRILGFDYKSLLPKAWVEGEPGKTRHAFFLMFPPSRVAQLDALCLYLRSCDRQCLIHTAREEGSWDRILTQTDCCTIIIHEAATWALRTLRQVHRLMPAADSRASFWRATEAMTPYSGIPLGESERWAPPGKIGLHRLLPSGKVILLTPSFLLTQPYRAAEFLMWYSNNIGRSRHTRTSKIVVAHGVCDYLRGIAEQKWMAYKNGTGSKTGSKQTGEASVSRDDCNVTETAWTVLQELFETSTNGCSWRDEDLSPIVCAPEGLAPSDEQSLVNWFGWWSIMNLDAYRCFIVLGTDEHDVKNSTEVTVTTDLPTFHPDTVNDPDGRTASSGQTPANYPELKFPCRRLQNDRPGSMISFLDGLIGQYKKTSAILYKFPVGFTSNESRPKAPGYHARLESIQSWFAYLPPFSWLSVGEVMPARPKWTKPVYGGLFYTAVDHSDGSSRNWREGQGRRHPWLAFYRPARPHMLSRTKFDGQYELIIWDWTTPSKFSSDEDPTDDKLSPEQRELINFVDQNTGAKNPGSQLESVWLGGPRSVTSNAHPMDVTLDFLEDVMKDIKIALPAVDYQLRNANYRRVIPQSQGYDALLRSQGRGEEMVYSDIFQPPRGNGSSQPSRCKNLFFEQARQALERGKVARDGTFSYKFEPTMNWYEQQRKEGRGFEHMLVGPWRAGFEVLRIGKEGKDGGSSGSPNSST